MLCSRFPIITPAPTPPGPTLRPKPPAPPLRINPAAANQPAPPSPALSSPMTPVEFATRVPSPLSLIPCDPSAPSKRKRKGKKGSVDDVPAGVMETKTMTVHVKEEKVNEKKLAPTPSGYVKASMTISPGGGEQQQMYPCTFEGCGKTFSRPYNLKSHMNCHSGKGSDLTSAHIARQRLHVSMICKDISAPYTPAPDRSNALAANKVSIVRRHSDDTS
ncbi:hypothetical protein HK102_001327 [Quaeritorhiza haematococci]|nr:hypothetical protein HK102_001327 [Quaeritorhiza haematococci]